VHQLRLATGKRINSASDDAAGFVISRKMEGRVRALSASLDNVGDAQNILSIAEGGYNTIADLLTQIKDKQSRFQNGGLGSAEKDAIATEVDQLATEIDDIVAQTKFNGKTLLDGSFVAGVAQSGGTLVVGDVAASAGTVTEINVAGAKASTTYTLSDLGSGVLRLTRGGDNVAQDVTVSASSAGTAQTINFSQLGISIKMMGTATATAAATATALVAAGTTIITNAGSSAAFQVGDSGENFAMTFSAGVGSAALLGQGAGSITASNVGSLTVDAGLDTVLGKIGDIGAKMNRLSTKEANLTTAITNIEAAKSRIVDADVAKEQISAVKLQFLQQTATTQLAQANQTPQVFLSLFR
jgi:flagellin